MSDSSFDSKSSRKDSFRCRINYCSWWSYLHN